MKFDRHGKVTVEKQDLFPNLISEGKKYGLSEYQLSLLTRYLNDKRMLRIISLESFRQNAQAWLSALTGIVAEVLAMDARATLWLDKKTEKPRNWILSKINQVIPTEIDDIAIKAINTAQQFMDDKILPTKERIASDISSKMHDRYQYHANATHLGQTPKELKSIAKGILKQSKDDASDAIKELNKRKFQAAVTHGLYRDNNGYWRNTSKYQTWENAQQLKSINERIRTKNENKQEIPEEGKISKERENNGEGTIP